MSHKKIIMTFLFLFIVLLYGCKEKGVILETSPTYEDTFQEIDLQKAQTDLQSLISIEKKSFSIQDESDIERRMDFRFTMKNLTTDYMAISYIGYFPKELETYYLSSSKIEQDAVDLKPNQILDVSASRLVAKENSITKYQDIILKNNGHEIYFAISINEQSYYTKVKFDELGVHQWLVD